MATKNRLTKADYEMLAALRFALRQFLRFSENAALAAGITPQQHQALLAIKGFPGRDRVSVRELAERLQLRHHSAVGLVNRLEAEKLVRREVSTLDRRHVYLSLSVRGERKLERLSSANREQLRRIRPRLNRLLESLGRDEK